MKSMGKESELTFRELNENDHSSVVNVVKDIWEGNDYVPSIFKNWVNTKNCFPYGAFNNNKELVGLGNLRLLTKNVGYIEGIRVDPSKQKKGIGKLLFKYAHDLAITKKVVSILFATYSKNHASISIGQKLGFELITRLESLFLEKKNIPAIDKIRNGEIEELTTEEALENLISKKETVKEFLCIGWSFAVLEKEYLPVKGTRWLSSNKNLLLVQEEDITRENILHEVPKEGYLWLTLYAENENIEDLLEEVIISNKDRDIKEIQLFCSKEAVETAQKYGFSYWVDYLGGIVLYKKNL